MKRMPNAGARSFSAAVLVTVLALGRASVSEGGPVITPDPTLPPHHPDPAINSEIGYAAAQHALFAAAGLTIDMTNIFHANFSNRVQTTQGSNEMESFDSTLTSRVSINGGVPAFVSLQGPVEITTFLKAGQVTGTFSTEMTRLDLVGSVPGLGTVKIRESPTRASTGLTTITSVGGGNFRIDSFFDVFTELSLDGGATFIPQSNGPSRVTLNMVPEPASSVLAGVGLAVILVLAPRWRGRSRRTTPGG